MKLRTYCLACRKHTINIASRKVTMINKVVRDKSRCGECLSDKLRFLKQIPNKNVASKYYKTNMLILLFKMQKKNKKMQRIMMQKW